MVRIQQALHRSHVQKTLWRMLHPIQDEADCLLDEDRDQFIVPSFLPVDAMEVKSALGQLEPANWLVNPEHW